MSKNPFQKVPESPTRPGIKKANLKFDVERLFSGHVQTPETQTTESNEYGLDEKLRKAYFWIVNKAIISPYYDIEYNEGPAKTYVFTDMLSSVTFPSGQSYSSYVLLPLLTLVTRKRCLLIGGPGRGKTASAILMGLLAGYSIKEIHRAIQHGQPQMTISDLLGNPIPSDLLNCKSMDDIKIAWRKWLGMRVKIIDEYNRIPTRTQSALLTVLADNYAEILDQVYECPDAAWYLTANDDAGGGTYQVIEALRDRIDIVVKALHFNTRFLRELLQRIESNVKLEEIIPQEIIFTEEEINQINKEILEVKIPYPLLRRIEFFVSHFEFSEVAAEQMEYKTKDTIKLSGLDYRTIVVLDTGKDKIKDLGSQTKNGLSVRALMTILTYVKALAYFRGNIEVAFEDVRHILPFVLHDKLTPDLDSPFFNIQGNEVYKTDKISWIRKLFDLSCEEFDRLSIDTQDSISDLEREFERGLEGVSLEEVNKRLEKIDKVMEEIAKSKKIYGHALDDILKLKYLHQRYINYRAWLS